MLETGEAANNKASIQKTYHLYGFVELSCLIVEKTGSYLAEERMLALHGNQKHITTFFKQVLFDHGAPKFIQISFDSLAL